MNYRTDLILGEAFCIFFHFPASGLAVLTGLQFYTFSPPRENCPKHSVGAEGAFGLRSILPALHNHWLLLVICFCGPFVDGAQHTDNDQKRSYQFDVIDQ